DWLKYNLYPDGNEYSDSLLVTRLFFNYEVIFSVTTCSGIFFLSNSLALYLFLGSAGLLVSLPDKIVFCTITLNG
ncbi:hypothetical protein, partial [Methanosarcina sp.]|uniref:hypothetical protein n=1 Tax=Methanosarcina sp. TaxID=2213 RepID=UPI002ABCB985